MDILTLVLFGLAILLILSSALGLLRLPDPMCRLHATGKIGSLAVVLVLVANLSNNLSIYALLKTGLIISLVYYTSAHATHVISNSMLKKNINPNSNL